MYTKGKWEYYQEHEEDEPVVKLESGNRILQTFYGGDSRNERRANARLIAAAPVLLEACKNIKEIMDYEGILDMTDVAVLNELEAAISRAEKE